MRVSREEVSLRTAGGDSSAVVHQSWILAATILASSMAFIDSTVVNVALPALQASFHASLIDVQWVVEAYGLFLAALILVGGSLGDLCGRRLIFISGVLIFALASAGCSFALTIHQLILARSVQGVGAALLVPGSLAIISTSFDEKSRGQAIGTWSGFTAITTAVGPVLGGWLVQHGSWRWVFILNLPLAAAVIAISLRCISESRSSSARRIDWVGAALATIGLGGVVYGFVESSHLGWISPFVWGSLTVGASSIIGFVFAEGRISEPMLPLALFGSRSFAGTNLLTLFLYAAVGAFFFLFPMNLIQVQGYSSSEAGAAILPMILLMFLLSRWSGGLVRRIGSRTPLVVGPLIVAAGFVLFSVSLGSNYWTKFFPAIMVLGFGMAVTVAPLTTAVMGSVDQQHAGTASGINNAVARVAGVLAIAILGIVMVKAFGQHLENDLTRLNLPVGTVQQLRENQIKLAAMPLPADLSSASKEELRKAIDNAFHDGFRIVVLICAGLAVASSATAGLAIRESRGEGHQAKAS